MGYRELYDRHLHHVGTRNGPWPNLLDRIKDDQQRKMLLYESGTITEGEMINQFLDLCEFYADCCAEAGFDIARVQE